MSIEVGTILPGKVTGITNFGAFALNAIILLFSSCFLFTALTPLMII